ncbi:unnamed protein product [Phaedon cochleariae]|uniref:Mitochondrial import inner membrane translocase subunit Tim16 n=1 Tax=Phaedon cochleariae TaxID=80249 RepID=A0A9N9X4A9_PHACE|nr:unnamed protein product [Phaedon cochleariae]
MVKTLPKILYHGVKIFLRSLKKSISEEIELSNQAARMRYDQNKSHAISETAEQMTLNEAKLVLHVDRCSPEEMEERFLHLFEVNKKENGGSFYLQSKVVRAKERIELEMRNGLVNVTNG